MIAHVGGVPLEEILPAVTGAGGGLLLARAWLILHLRRGREPGKRPENETLGMAFALTTTRHCVS